MRPARLVTDMRRERKSPLDERLDGLGRNKVCCEAGKCRICRADNLAGMTVGYDSVEAWCQALGRRAGAPQCGGVRAWSEPRGLSVAMNQAMLRLNGLGYLSAVDAPDPDREALVSKLSVVMSSTEARKTVAALESLVEKRASSGASKVVTKALWGFVIVNVLAALWRMRR